MRRLGFAAGRPEESALANPEGFINLEVRVKFRLFQALELASQIRQRLSASKKPATQPENRSPPIAHRRGAVWVFVSTIGELNLVEPLLTRLLGELPGVPMMLLTDRPIYRESYQAKYPEAFVYYCRGTVGEMARLCREVPPLGLLIVEIPSLPSDAPCRLPFSAVYEVKRRGLPLAIVNGWLYRYPPPSRLDRLERRWLGKAYVRAFDLITVQDEEVRRSLIAAGAQADRVHTTGNLKFDSVLPSLTSPVGPQREPDPPQRPAETGRPVVVAGCISHLDEQDLVLDAFARLLRRVPEALLVFAPRHPENAAAMAALKERLDDLALSWASRTRLAHEPVSDSIQCLVLDTFGELRTFYSRASVAFVGRDHNLLEPLAFRKPTTTTGRWDSTYPSFPVYRLLSAAKAILTCDTADALAATWESNCAPMIAKPERHDRLTEVISGLQGATVRTLELLRSSFTERVLDLWSNRAAEKTK